MMNIKMMTASAALLTLLMACSKAPDGGAATADAASHDDHADAAVAMLPRTPAPAGARVFIVSPEDGATVSSPVHVVFGAEGIDVVPATEQSDHAGHHHLLVDTDLADPAMPIPADAQHIHYGQAQTEATIELEPGTHTLQLVMGDHLHVPFDPVIASPTISITVN